mgnify:CR=1 FL=1
MLYLRRISEDAWVNKPLHDSDSVSDLATQNHELSVWHVDDNLNNFEDSVLALALTKDMACGIFVAVLNLDKIKNAYNWDIKVTDQPGDTAYVALKDRHKNFEISHINEMGNLAEHIHNLILAEDSIRYVDEQRLTQLIAEKIDSKELAEVDLNKKGKWKKALKAYRLASNGQ